MLLHELHLMHTCSTDLWILQFLRLLLDLFVIIFSSHFLIVYECYRKNSVSFKPHLMCSICLPTGRDEQIVDNWYSLTLLSLQPGQLILFVWITLPHSHKYHLICHFTVELNVHYSWDETKACCAFLWFNGGSLAKCQEQTRFFRRPILRYFETNSQSNTNLCKISCAQKFTSSLERCPVTI